LICPLPKPFRARRIEPFERLERFEQIFSDVAGEESLMIGSDYTHRDSSMEYEFPRLLKERAEKGESTQSAVQKILYDNAKTFYGL
jgi:predicted TIM-barrel fold metal-dependent hydrolase